MALKKQLPIGISTLQEIINEGFLYVDKTEIIHRLITGNRRCFISRPRRFGKSLFISTLQEIFLGNKELFKDLWIGQGNRYHWQARPVVTLDFSKMNSHDATSLEKSLNLALDRIAQDHQITIDYATTPDDKINELISELGKKNKVAVLVDEYDAPLLKHIDAPEIAESVRTLLASFYATIKALDSYIHFTLVTGVTKFSKTSLFSGANNLHDLSLSEKYATLCGYTESEILTNFDAYITDCATKSNSSNTIVMTEMRTWYNGYQMSDYLTEKVYNPFSVLLYLENQKFKNYWFSTGTPTFLIKLIKENLTAFTAIDHSVVDSDMLSTFETDPLALRTILYQAGYLTIENFDERGHSYTLTYPNEEVRQSLNQVVMRSVLELKDESTQTTINMLRDALYAKDIITFCQALQIIFAHIPYQLHLEKESFYHALLQMICYMLGIEVASEISVASGSIDMVIQTNATIYVFEFKLNRTAAEALNQIHKRRYYEKYLLNNKELYLVGISFHYETKTITHAVEKITP